METTSLVLFLLLHISSWRLTTLLLAAALDAAAIVATALCRRGAPFLSSKVAQ